MAIVLAFANLKGGSGKTLLSVNVAAALHRATHRVLIVDADPQGSSTAWGGRAAELGHDGPPVVAMPAASLRRDLPRVAEAYDVVIVDGPARIGDAARAAMLVADLVVVPISPGAADAWAAAETIRVLNDARAFRPELRAVTVLNRVDRTILSRLAQKAIAELGVAPLDVTVGARVALGEAMLTGQGVCDTAPTSDAARDIRRFTKALLAAVATEKSGEAAA